jgi:hypothetical protein
MTTVDDDVKTCPRCGYQERRVRSQAQHNRYFAVIEALFHHWPEHHLVTGEVIDFVPDDPTHLRKLLQIKAGYRNVTLIEVPGDNPTPKDIKQALAVAEAVAEVADPYIFIRLHGGALAVFTSKSINYDTLTAAPFIKLSNAVDEVIVTETGFDPETLLREHRRAA